MRSSPIHSSGYVCFGFIIHVDDADADLSTYGRGEKNVDWNAMEMLQVVPPMRPTVAHEEDTSNFDVKFTKLPPSDLVCDDIVDDNDNSRFRGFSFHRSSPRVSELIEVPTLGSHP